MPVGQLVLFLAILMLDTRRASSPWWLHTCHSCLLMGIALWI